VGAWKSQSHPNPSQFFLKERADVRPALSCVPTNPAPIDSNCKLLEILQIRP